MAITEIEVKETVSTCSKELIRQKLEEIALINDPIYQRAITKLEYLIKTLSDSGWGPMIKEEVREEIYRLVALREYFEWQPMETLPDDHLLLVLAQHRSSGSIFTVFIDRREPETRLSERLGDHSYCKSDFSGWRRIT